MPVDFSQYVDLTLYDATPTDIYLGSIELARTTLPEFALRSGTPEDAIFQAMSYIQMLSVAAINRIPNRLMEGVVKLAGVERDLGTRATITVKVMLSSVTSLEIPLGTAFTYSVPLGQTGESLEYTFLTTEDISILSTDIAMGDTLPSKQVSLTSQMLGYHLMPAQYDELVVQQNFPEILNVQFITYSSTGRNPEDDDVFLNRCASTLQSFSNVNTTASQLKYYVLTTSDAVVRCKAYDLTSPLNMNLFPTPAAAENGSVCVTVYGQNRFLTALERTDLALDLADRANAGLDIQVVDMTLCDQFEVTIDVVLEPDADEDDTTTDITSAVEIFLSPLGFTSTAEGLSAGELSKIISNVHGVAYVASLEFNSTAGTQFPQTSPYTTGVSFLPFASKGCLPNIDSANITLTVQVAESVQGSTLETL